MPLTVTDKTDYRTIYDFLAEHIMGWKVTQVQLPFGKTASAWVDALGRPIRTEDWDPAGFPDDLATVVHEIDEGYGQHPSLRLRLQQYWYNVPAEYEGIPVNAKAIVWEAAWGGNEGLDGAPRRMLHTGVQRDMVKAILYAAVSVANEIEANARKEVENR